MNWTSLTIWIAIGFGAWTYFQPQQVKYPHGIQIAEVPSQWPPPKSDSWIVDGITFTPLAKFHIDGMVLSTERYWVDEMSVVSPVDFLIGWGPMARAENLTDMTFKQYGRWGHFEWTGSPKLTKELAQQNMANIHIIPADEEIRNRLLAVKAAEVITMRGSLVELRGPNGLSMKSSLSRTDTDGGACEILWVEKITDYVPRAISSTSY